MLNLIKHYINLPSCLFHEGCHIIMAILLGIRFKSITPTINNTKIEINCELYNTDEFDIIIVAIAPMIGLFLLFIYNPLFTLIWFIIGYKGFLLSEADHTVIKRNFNNLKLRYEKVF